VSATVHCLLSDRRPPGRRDEDGIGLGERTEGLVDVGDDIVHVLDADRQPHELGCDARRLQLVVRELGVGRRGGVDDERLGVADIGEVRNSWSSSTKTGPGLPSGLEPEGEESAVVPLVIVAVLTGTTAVLRRRWLAALRDLGDRQVIIEGLGPVLAAMIRSRSRSVSDLARADTLDQRHTGRDAELQPAVRKRACR
jgi:hypothetical protein